MPAVARLTLSHAARVLDVTPETVRRYVARGLFTPSYPHGKGPGKPCYLRTDEVEAAVLDWRTAERRAAEGLLKGRWKRLA